MNPDDMPRYTSLVMLSHEEVRALKVRAIDSKDDGGATITPEEAGYAPFDVNAAYVSKYQPQAGGYYMRFRSGDQWFQEFSPADVFEQGHEAA